MKTLIISLIVFLFLAVGYTVTKAAYPEVVVTLTDGSSYGITFLGVNDKTYSYNVREISGKNLSHFVLELPFCLEKEAFVSWTPVDGVLGHDPTTGGDGIKWNTESEFTQGIFTFELDEQYAVGEVDVYFKAATMVNSGKILGPLCESVSPTSTTTPTETPTSTVTATETETPTFTATAEAPTATMTPTNTDTPVPTETNVVEDTATPTLTVTVTTELPTNESDGIEPKKLKVFMPLITKQHEMFDK